MVELCASTWSIAHFAREPVERVLKSSDLATDAVAFHSRIAQSFHSSYQYDANRNERIYVWKQYLDKYTTKSDFAYDLGCGSGVLTAILASLAHQVIAIDGAAGMLKIAEDQARNLGYSNIAFQQRRLPIDDILGMQPADLIMSSSVIEYLDSPCAALYSIRKLLRDDGILIFSMSNASSLARKIVRVCYRLTGKPEYLGYVRHFVTLDSMRAELRQAQFDVLEYAYFGRADRLNRLLRCVLPRRWASNMILFVARKKKTATAHQHAVFSV
jgi:SAM-dependent methyltransferase